MSGKQARFHGAELGKCPLSKEIRRKKQEKGKNEGEEVNFRKEGDF
jgi:hypothetical protein